MKYIFSVLVIILVCGEGVTQASYADDIAEIIYKKCSSCHRPGEVGPMTLTSYEEVSSWGQTIKFVTENRIMPPWQPDPQFSNFLEENFLSDEEIRTIAEWVDTDMPRGDVANEPEFPDFPSGSVLGTPDLVLEMSEEWIHEGNNQDDYRYFVLPTGLLEDKVVKAMEFRPGNSSIVHHALIFEDTEGIAAARDAQTPEYGFDGFGSFNTMDPASILTQKQFPGYVPGQKPIRFPDGVGQILQAGADLVVQLHYAPWPIDESDQSTINIFFMDEQVETFERELDGHIMVPLPSVINDQFFIRAGETKTFHGQYEIPTDISLVNISPHMHLLGKHWEVWLDMPDGERVNLINIPDWDFNWQGSYYFDRYIVAPAGSILNAVASYDNTIDNPNNPSNPPRFVTWGEGTTDEMYYLPIGFVDYQDGDENIVFTDNTVSATDLVDDFSQIYPIRPNPVDDFTVVGFRLEKGQPLNFTIYDMSGAKVRSLRTQEFYNTGEHFINFSSKNLPSGTYFLRMEGEIIRHTQKFVKL